MSFFEKLFGSFSDKELKRINPLKDKVLALEPEMAKLTDEELQAKTTEFDVYSKCVDALLDGEVDAVTTDDAILAGYAANEPDSLKVVGEKFSDEPYGIGLAKGDTELQDFIATALKNHEDNGDYEKAYAATLGLSGTPMPAIPKITEGTPA